MIRSLKGFMLTAAAAVSAVLFLSIYATTTEVFDRVVKDNASAVSKTLAESTFNSMFQIMRQGWTRSQVEEFLHAVQQSSADATYRIDIYRGELVSELFGPIEQPDPDAAIRQTFSKGDPLSHDDSSVVRQTFPLTARGECLRCHVNAVEGDVLGVIDVRQDIAPLVEEAESQLLFALLIIAPIPLLVALGVAVVFQRKVDSSVRDLQQNIERVNRVSDLTTLEIGSSDLGFTEFNSLLAKLGELTEKLKSVAVDKDLLEFEIRLLEKFVITSEVVRDWREYISYLLIDINQVIEAYTLFSIFKVDDELFDMEIFWYLPPTDETRRMMEEAVRRALSKHPSFSGMPVLEIHHHISQPAAEPISFNAENIELQTKSLIVETPKIGGIVGIGVQAEIVKDKMRLLVMESILSTLLNVVGSVKAIYKYTKDLEYYATRDPLTNLYNQRLFWELLGYEVNRADRHGYEFTLLVIDLDNFKSINDTHGHAFGDSFLRDFAAAVQDALRTGDVFARYGGDEFVLILPEAGIPEATAIANRILHNAGDLVLEAPDRTGVKATVSIGVAVYPTHATDVKDLFLFADNMMYKAKAEGKNRLGVPTETDVVDVFRDIGEKSLIISNAIEHKSIVPHFQPIVESGSGEVIAVEVLSRIALTDDRLLGAHEFIEIAEKMGQIHKLDLIVMEKAFEASRNAGYQGLIFLNLSPRALVLGEFGREARQLTTQYGIDPGRVVFEITERDTVKNLALLEKFVNDLKFEGFLMAIDDFGSGFSSFHYLKRFPIDFVKIEGDFVVNMANDTRDAAFVRSIAALSQELGIATIAEYVENEEVLAYVREAGIGFAQGFHTGRPGPDLAEVARNHRAHDGRAYFSGGLKQGS